MSIHQENIRKQITGSNAENPIKSRKRSHFMLKEGFVSILKLLLGIIALLFLFDAISNVVCPNSISKENVSSESWQIAILAITALVALIVYQDSKQVDESRMLIELRNDLNSEQNREIHKILELRYKERQENSRVQYESFFESDIELRCNLYNYIGTLEMLNILIEKDIVSEEAFKNQFGYRVRNIVDDPECVSLLDARKSDWKDFLTLVERFPEYEQMYRKTKNRK